MYASRERFCESVHMLTGEKRTKILYNGPVYLLMGRYIENSRFTVLISSLPGKALRMLVDIARLAKRFNMRSQSRAW